MPAGWRSLRPLLTDFQSVKYGDYLLSNGESTPEAFGKIVPYLRPGRGFGLLRFRRKVLVCNLRALSKHKLGFPLPGSGTTDLLGLHCSVILLEIDARTCAQTILLMDNAQVRVLKLCPKCNDLAGCARREQLSPDNPIYDRLPLD